MITKPIKLTAMGMVHTPDNMKSFENYISKFSGSEAPVAVTCGFMGWNLACKLTTPPEGYVDMRMSHQTLETLLFLVRNCQEAVITPETYKEWSELRDSLQELRDETVKEN